MTTISISLDDDSKKQLDHIAQQMKRSRSDVVRDMVAWYNLKLAADAMQQQTAPFLRKLGLETDEQIAAYADQA